LGSDNLYLAHDGWRSGSIPPCHCHCATPPLCHRTTAIMPLYHCHYAIVPLPPCHHTIATLPSYHCYHTTATLPPCHCATSPLCHLAILPLCNFATLPPCLPTIYCMIHKMSFEVTCLFKRYFTLQASERFLYLFERFCAPLCIALPNITD
jgi:hypothetical protein